MLVAVLRLDKSRSLTKCLIVYDLTRFKISVYRFFPLYRLRPRLRELHLKHYELLVFWEFLFLTFLNIPQTRLY